MDQLSSSESSAGSSETGLEGTHLKADAGDAEAQFSLGLHYSVAPGEPPQLEKAASYYRKAADQHHALAQFNLGVMFAKGQGVSRDEATATLWMRRAANGGDAGAQFHLGTRCHRASFSGPHAEASNHRIESFKWFRLAAAQGYGESDLARDRVTCAMTREELAEANDRADRFVVASAGQP